MVLGSNNYHSRERAMLHALSSKNKIKFVNGSISKPESTDPLFEVWERCNDYVISWITLSLSPDIAQSVMWHNVASDLWKDLKHRYFQGDVFKVAGLEKEMFTLRQGDLNMTDYFTRLKSIWEELENFRPLPDCIHCKNRNCTCGTVMRGYRDETYIVHFLRGLNEQYATVRSQIMLMQSLPSIEQAFLLLLQQERQFQCGEPLTENKILMNNATPYQPSTQGGRSRGRGGRTAGRGRGQTKHGLSPHLKQESSAINNAIIDDKNFARIGDDQLVEDSGIELEFTREQKHALLALLKQPPLDTHKPQHAINQIVTLPSHQVSKTTNLFKCELVFDEKCCKNQDCLSSKMIGVAEQRKGLYAFEDLKPLVQAQFNKAIKQVRSDNGAEFKLTEFYAEKAFAATIHATRKKLDPRARKCIFLGYKQGVKSSTTPPTSSRYPLSHVLSYHGLSENKRKFSIALITNTDPKTYEEAMMYPCWQEDIKSELAALDENRTWSLTTLPADKHAIGCKWVFKTKLKADGSVERCKARLVAKGFTQVPGQDYSDTFSPIVKMNTLRILLAIAAAKDWFVHQLDVNTAFLYGDLEEKVYMKPPPGLNVSNPKLICKLEKSLYGLKQASRQWNSKLAHTLIKFGYTQSKHDYILFTKVAGSGFTTVIIYVDDLVLAGNCIKEITALKQHLHNLFKIKDIGELKFFLGFEFARSKRGIAMYQRKYCLDLLEEYGMLRSKSCSTPMDYTSHLSKESGDPMPNASEYRRLLGRLLYLTNTRPEISFVVGKLSQFLDCPTNKHF
ncbi:uncharacterized protein [Arachis hypogaea]|uniref:uncharacterized protein n=1 Tax=Arachis hypogaea TaxID=3818 RepID=UPI003B21A53D